MRLDAPRIAVTAGLVVFFDQLTKWMVRRSFEVGQQRDFLPFFSLCHVENTGAAFGMGIGRNLFFIVSSVVVLGLLYWVGRRLPQNSWLCSSGQGLVWGGALGNLADRLLSGHVTDFLDFYIGAHHWPSFNLADSAITVGASFLFMCTFF